MSVNDLPKLIKEYGKDITFMGGIDNGKVDCFDWNQEMIEDQQISFAETVVSFILFHAPPMA